MLDGTIAYDGIDGHLQNVFSLEQANFEEYIAPKLMNNTGYCNAPTYDATSETFNTGLIVVLTKKYYSEFELPQPPIRSLGKVKARITSITRLAPLAID